jgi:hypothetical protein
MDSGQLGSKDTDDSPARKPTVNIFAGLSGLRGTLLRTYEPSLQKAVESLTATAALSISPSLLDGVVDAAFGVVAKNLSGQWDNMVEAAVAVALPAGFRLSSLVAADLSDSVGRIGAGRAGQIIADLLPSIPSDALDVFNAAWQTAEADAEAVLAAEERGAYGPDARARAVPFWSKMSPVERFFAAMAVLDLIVSLLGLTPSRTDVNITINAEQSRESRTLAELDDNEVDALAERLLARIEELLAEVDASESASDDGGSAGRSRPR